MLGLFHVDESSCPCMFLPKHEGLAQLGACDAAQLFQGVRGHISTGPGQIEFTGWCCIIYLRGSRHASQRIPIATNSFCWFMYFSWVLFLGLIIRENSCPTASSDLFANIGFCQYLPRMILETWHRECEGIWCQMKQVHNIPDDLRVQHEIWLNQFYLN